jgi:spermidine synthase
MKFSGWVKRKLDGPLTIRRFWVCLLALGTSSVCVQLVVIREVMSSFSGNELVIGLVLGAWLLFTGLGSALGVPLARTARPERVLCWGHIIVAFLPFFQLAAIRALPLLWVRGEMLGLGPAVLSSASVLFPYCLVAGAMIPVAGAFLSGRGTTSKVYIADTVGDIAGGLIFSLVFVYTLSHWDSLILLGLLNLFAAALMTSRAVLVIPIVLGVGILAARPLDVATTSWRFPGQDVLLHKNTPFAQLTISKTGQQLNVLQDAIPLFSTDDLDMEAKAHVPLCQVRQGAKVLLIAGGVFGTLEEMAKHKPKRIDYVELDPAVLDLDRHINRSLSHPFVHVHIGDGRLFVKKSSMQYDAIIVDLPDPENTQLNRFYSQEFFHEAKSILTPEGVLSFSLVGSENYLEEMGLAVNRSVYSALTRAFEHVVVFPGLTHHYLASDSPLTTEVADVLSKRGIATRRLVDYELPAMVDPFRMDLLRRLLIEKDVSPNRDLSPTAFGHLLDMWLKKSGSSKNLLYVLFAVTLGFAAVACRRDLIRFTIMTSGYAAMAFELSLILLFQVIYGYVYLRICLFVTLFMIGSVLGAFVSGRTKKGQRWQMLGTDAALVVLACVAGVRASFGVGWKDQVALFAMQYAVIPSLVFLVAFAAGYQFSAASRMARGTEAQITGRLYVADLAGAACGTILTGLLFLPRIGIIGVLVSVLFFKGLSLALNWQWDG